MFLGVYIFSQISSLLTHWAYLAIIIGTIFVIVLDNRSPVKTLAWVMVLTFLPFLGLVLYFFFGRTQRREKLISKRLFNKFKKHRQEEEILSRNSAIPERYSGISSLLENTDVLSCPYTGNDVQIYYSGSSWIISLIKDMYQAKSHIHLQSYIFDNDAVGRLVSDVLIDKAREGIEVRVLYDDVGSWNVPQSFIERLRDAGVDIRGFLKVRFPLFTDKVNYRNHRKVAVIDGSIGYIGGMNIADRYVKGLEWGIWRDTHLRIKGVGVYGLQMSFLQDWFFVVRAIITSGKYFPKVFIDGKSTLQIVTSTPIYPGQEIIRGMVSVIANAKKYVYLQTPYFLPSEIMLFALQTAALSGVDVRIMLPMKADNILTHLCSCSYLMDVAERGCKVYFYKKGFLHSKMLVSDDGVSTVGSTNIDFRSFEHNFEINVFVYDVDVAHQLRNMFVYDMTSCKVLNIQEWRSRPWYRRVAESIIRLMSPLL